MDIERFVENYPYLYHMAEYSSWDSIRQYGLLSTSALLDLFEIKGTERVAIESCRRPSSVIIKHHRHGTATIRDQKPLSDNKLNKCLIGCGTSDWYRILNHKVFFWPTEDKVRGLLSARAYRSIKHTIIIIDSESLIRRHQVNIFLSPINSGATIYQPTPRGPRTFVHFSEWPDEIKARSGKLKKPVAEVAIEYGIPDICDFVVCIAEGRNGQLIKH